MPVSPSQALRQLRASPSWVFTAFKVLARIKGVRGGPLDVFARSAERRAERRMIEDYFGTIGETAKAPGPESHALAVELASLPRKIRGFGPVKMRSIESADHKRAGLLDALRAPEAPATAAE